MTIMNRRTIPVGGGADLAVNAWAGRSSIQRRRGLAPSSVQPVSMAIESLVSFGSRQGNAGLVAAGDGKIQGWMDPEPTWGDVIGNPQRNALQLTLNMYDWEQRIGGVVSILSTDQIGISMVEDISTGVYTGSGPGTSTSYKPDGSVCAVVPFTGTFTLYRVSGSWYMNSPNYFFSPINLGVSDPRQTIPLNQSGTAGVISCLWPASAVRVDTATLVIT